MRPAAWAGGVEEKRSRPSGSAEHWRCSRANSQFWPRLSKRSISSFSGIWSAARMEPMSTGTGSGPLRPPPDCHSACALGYSSREAKAKPSWRRSAPGAKSDRRAASGVVKAMSSMGAPASRFHGTRQARTPRRDRVNSSTRTPLTAMTRRWEGRRPSITWGRSFSTMT